MRKLIAAAILAVPIVTGIAACSPGLRHESSQKPASDGNSNGSSCASYAIDQSSTVGLVETGPGCTPRNLTIIPGLPLAPMTGVAAPPPWSNLAAYCTVTDKGIAYKVIELGSDPTNASAICLAFERLTGSGFVIYSNSSRR